MFSLVTLGKKVGILFVITVLSAVTNFYAPSSYSFVPNQGLKTESRLHSSGQQICDQTCTVNTQGSYSRSSATLALLDESVASIPPGSLIVGVAVLCVAVYSYTRKKYVFYSLRNFQQAYCLWRF